MTEAYDLNPMPHIVDVKCPRCGLSAEFEFAETRRIELKKDVEFFEKHALFEYRKFLDPHRGCYWHAAIYYVGLHGDPNVALAELPEGYKPSDWSHPKYHRYKNGPDIGSVCCEYCHLKMKHELDWPSDAYFTISYKHNVLWAFNRESACDLYNYILSKDREISNYRWSSFLLHVPTVFKTQKARKEVSKQLLRLLEGGSSEPGSNKSLDSDAARRPT